MTLRTSETNSEVTDFFSRTSKEFLGSYSTDPDFRERLDLWKKLILEHAPGRKNALDLGCGPGLLTIELLRQELFVTAVDGSPAMVALCEKNSRDVTGRTEYINDFLPTLDRLAARQFELLLCSSVLEYVSELDSSLQRITELLAPGGIAILSMPNRQSLYRRMETLKFNLTGKPEYRAYVKHMLTPIELAEKAARAGLAHTGTFYYGAGNGPAARLARVFPAPLRKNLFVCVLCKK